MHHLTREIGNKIFSQVCFNLKVIILNIIYLYFLNDISEFKSYWSVSFRDGILRLWENMKLFSRPSPHLSCESQLFAVPMKVEAFWKFDWLPHAFLFIPFISFIPLFVYLVNNQICSFIRLFGCSVVRLDFFFIQEFGWVDRLFGYACQFFFRLFVIVYSVIRVRLFVSAVQLGVVLTAHLQFNFNLYICNLAVIHNYELYLMQSKGMIYMSSLIRHIYHPSIFGTINFDH